MNTGIFYSDTFLQHIAPLGHLEKEGRLTSILRSLEKVNFFNFALIEPREATQEELELVHTKEHIQRIKQASLSSNYLDPDTYASRGSYEAALKAAGSVIQAIDMLNKGRLKQAFCLLRPPGHHATANQAMGFCLFNNVAVGAAWLVKNFGKKVAILDFDAHHGNGTQEIFFSTNKVLYCSWHEWPHYPGTGALGEIGEGEGKGFSLNIPLAKGANDDDFISSLNKKVLPVLEQFKPDLIIVSAGYDSHKDDPLSQLCFTEEGYTAFTKIIANFCQRTSAGLLISLEGGYNLRSLSNSVLKTLATLADNI